MMNLKIEKRKNNRKLQKTSFLKNVVVLLIAHVFIKILGVVNKIYLTNREGFGDEGNAIYSSAFQIYALFLTICSIGIPNAVSKIVSERLAIGDAKGAHKTFKLAIIAFGFIGFLASLFVFTFASRIANEWIQIPEAELSLLALSPSIFFVSITSVIKGYFNGRENLNIGANSQTVEQICRTILTIGLIEFIAQTTGMDTRIMAAGAAISSTIAEITCFVYLFKYYTSVRREIANEIKRGVNYKYKGIRKTLREILLVSIPMSIGPIIGGINRNIDSMTIVRGLKNFMTDTEAKLQYGILSGKVDTLVSFPLSFNSAFTSTLIPIVSSAKSSGNYENAIRKIDFSMLISVLIGLPSSIGFICLANPILNLLFPNQPDGAFLLQISATSITFIMLNQNINAVLHGLGKTLIPAIVLIASSTIKLILNTLLVKINPGLFLFGGTAGAALATVISHIFSFLIVLHVLKRNIKINFGIKTIVKPIIATVIMIACMTFAYNILIRIISEKMCIIIAIVIAIIVYFLLILILKVFSEKEIKMLPFGEILYKILQALKIYK